MMGWLGKAFFPFRDTDISIYSFFIFSLPNTNNIQFMYQKFFRQARTGKRSRNVTDSLIVALGSTGPNF